MPRQREAEQELRAAEAELSPIDSGPPEGWIELAIADCMAHVRRGLARLRDGGSGELVDVCVAMAERALKPVADQGPGRVAPCVHRAYAHLLAASEALRAKDLA